MLEVGQQTAAGYLLQDSLCGEENHSGAVTSTIQATCKGGPAHTARCGYVTVRECKVESGEERGGVA